MGKNDSDLRKYSLRNDNETREIFENIIENERNNQTLKFYGIYLYRNSHFKDAIFYLKNSLILDDGDLETKLYLMRTLYSERQWDEVRPIAESIIAESADNLEALRVLARLHLNNRDLPAALPLWMRIADHWPNDHEAALQVARLAWRAEDHELAARYGAAFLAVAPRNGENLSILARSLQHLRKLDELAGLLPHLARDNWEEAARYIDVVDAAGLKEPLARALASLLHEQTEVTAAVPLVDELLFRWLAEAAGLELQGNDEGAAELYRAVLTVMPGSQEAVSSLARLKADASKDLREAQKAGDDDAVQQAAARLLALDPATAEARFALGRRELAQRRYPEAHAHLSVAVAGEPNNAWYQLNCGRAALGAGSFDKALDAFRAVANSGGNVADAYRDEAARSCERIFRTSLSQARKHMAAHEFASAWDCLGTAERANPRGADFADLRDVIRRRMYSDVSKLYRETPEQALEPLEVYLSMFPREERALVMHGRLDMQARNHAAALKSWETAASLAPDNAHYQLQIARCHAWLKNPEAAAAAAERVLQLEPGQSEAGTILASLRKDAE